MSNTYRTSSGEKFTTAQVESRMRIAKATALEKQFDAHDYNFCEECGRNASNTRLDCSHDISVKKAKENGQTEQCWNVGNITILCRECHQEKDKLNTQFT
ncbi:HNH endonuclease signature motif containing protein [Flavobacterium sp. LB2P84]|uniref:HNH endonuclease signature motif containing protein n=1 Tax=Flavobacterium yafengii TaxID=3041253 RepID=UPI0024A7C1D2|nr:HNH endonuclease signature motif containing protein [Flavobacterium yafengii]MDI6034011.1 HNH endonuclease signature motif containing protein [Flavobacterium yafengii]